MGCQLLAKDFSSNIKDLLRAMQLRWLEMLTLAFKDGMFYNNVAMQKLKRRSNAVSNGTASQT